MFSLVDKIFSLSRAPTHDRNKLLRDIIVNISPSLSRAELKMFFARKSFPQKLFSAPRTLLSAAVSREKSEKLFTSDQF